MTALTDIEDEIRSIWDSNCVLVDTGTSYCYDAMLEETFRMVLLPILTELHTLRTARITIQDALKFHKIKSLEAQIEELKKQLLK